MDNPFKDWDRYAGAEFKRINPGSSSIYTILAYDDHHSEKELCMNPDPECGHGCTRPKDHTGMCEVCGIRPGSNSITMYRSRTSDKWCHARWDPLIVILEEL